MKFKKPLKIPGTLNEVKSIEFRREGNTLIRETVAGPDERYYEQGQRMCDCCMKMVDRAVYMHQRGFGLVRHPGKYVSFDAGQWGFCVFCWALFRRREWKPLLARVMTLNPKLIEWWVADLHRTLEQVLYGDPIYEGDWTEEEKHP